MLIATVAINSSTKSIHREVESALNSIIDEKIGFIYNYINSKEKTVATYAHLPVVMESIQKLNSSFSEGIESLSYLRKNALFRPALMHLKTSLDSYDLFLINVDGDIVFSIAHEADFATNLRTGPYKSTQLAIVFEQATSLLETQISLYKPYAPSQHEIGSNIRQRFNFKGQENHNAFIAAPIFKNNNLLGVMAVQLKSRNYFHLTKDYSGLKKTGDIIFSQQVNEQIQNISPLRNQPDSEFQYSIPANSMFGIPSQNANKGEKGSGLSIDFEGNKVLAAWRYIPELQWGGNC